jgi:hypothetical protein
MAAGQSMNVRVVAPLSVKFPDVPMYCGANSSLLSGDLTELPCTLPLRRHAPQALADIGPSPASTESQVRLIGIVAILHGASAIGGIQNLATDVGEYLVVEAKGSSKRVPLRECDHDPLG